MAALLLPPIDLTGEPTAWAFQQLESYDPLRRVWTREKIRPSFGPATVWRAKVSDFDRWDPVAAWPVHMGERRGGYRARLLVWDGSKWQTKRSVAQ